MLISGAFITVSINLTSQRELTLTLVLLGVADGAGAPQLFQELTTQSSGASETLALSSGDGLGTASGIAGGVPSSSHFTHFISAPRHQPFIKNHAVHRHTDSRNLPHPRFHPHTHQLAYLFS